MLSLWNPHSTDTFCPIFRHWESMPTPSLSDPTVVSEEDIDPYMGEGHSDNYKEKGKLHPKGNCYQEVTPVLPKSQNCKVDAELKMVQVLWMFKFYWAVCCGEQKRSESLITLGILVKVRNLRFNNLSFPMLLYCGWYSINKNKLLYWLYLPLLLKLYLWAIISQLNV